MNHALPADAPIDVQLLLCKALRGGVMSEELAWRAWDFFHRLYFSHKPREGHHQVSIVSGGGGEANAVRVYLGMLQALLFQPRHGGLIGLFGNGTMFLESVSPNSRLNISCAVEKVRARGLRGPMDVNLYSSSYHCSALVELRYKLSAVSPFSFVKEPGAILDVVERPAPYLYPTCGIEELEWLAQIYLLRQSLRLAWENIRGISGTPGSEELKIPLGARRRLGLIVRPGTVAFLLEESVTRVEHAIVRLRALHDAPIACRPEFAARVGLAQQQIACFLSAVEPHIGWLKNHVGTVGSGEIEEWRRRAEALEPFLNPSHVRDIDPDMDGFGWEHLKPWSSLRIASPTAMRLPA